MGEELNSMGEMFRARRKELNLSLKEVENATSIRTTYLQAIEDGQMEKLISPIYAEGFSKQYAVFLGLDGERIVSEYAEIFKKSTQQDFAYGIGTLEMRGNPGAGVKWMPNAIWIAAFFVLLVVAYYFARVLEVI
ncbi:MAG: hypothetical protein JWO53_258 [Chlamydiia bacterium]|nr:hypothetical protein [Chlamydiia bacterium]